MTNEADTVQVNNTNSIVTYENPIQGIKIQYPSDWEKQEEEGARAMATTTLVNFLSLPRSINDQFPETLNVGVEDLPTWSFTLEGYTTLGINNLRTSLQDVNITDTTLAGNPAHKIVYTFTFIDEDNPSDQLPLKNMQIWTVKDGKAYIITYGGVVNQFPDSLADAQKMIDSFEIGDLITNTDATTMVKSATTERDNASNITMSNITAEANIA